MLVNYHKHIAPSHIKENLNIFIHWEGKVGWQIITEDGCIYTPQSFEAEFNRLPPPPPIATRKTRKEWYAHRRKSKSFKGFKRKNKSRYQTDNGDC